MTTTTSSRTYANLTSGDLSFTNIVADETDIVSGGGFVESFTANSGDPTAIMAGSETGMSWSGITMTTFSDGSGPTSQTVTITYDVTETGSNYITAIDSLYSLDVDTAGATFTAIETIASASSPNTILATQTFSSESTAPAPAVLSSPVQNAIVTLTMTETATGTNSEVSASIVDQLFAEGTPVLAALGDYVWFDTNGNGLQDSTETGVAGVTVDLLNAAGTSVLEVTTTNAAGIYGFTDLAPGTYEVQFVAPAGDNFTLTSQGSNTAIDSNANQTTGLTALVTLTAGQTDLTIDAGLVATPPPPAPPITIDKVSSVTAVQLGTTTSVSYTYTVTNTGTTALNNVTISDVYNGTTTYTYTDPNSLAPGATWTYTATPVSGPPPAPSTGSPSVGTAGGSGFSLGDAANYTLVFLKAGNNSYQQTSDSPVFGNVGIGDTGSSNNNVVQLSGGTITGQLVTTGAAPSNGGGGTVTNGITGNSGTLASDIAALESMSAALGQETGTAVNLNAGGTLQASSGTLDADGNYVFTVTALPNAPLTINGAGDHGVVLNYAGTGGWHITKNLVLTGGLTPNQVLFNLTGTGGQLQGAQPVVFNASILAPGSKVNIDGMTLNGHLYADNNQGNFQWVSGAAADNPSAYGVTDIATVTGSNSSGTATATDMARVQVGGASAVGNGHSSAPTPTVQIGGTAPTGNIFALEGGNAATLEFRYSPGTSVSTLGQNSVATATGGAPSSMAFIVVSNAAGDHAAGATDYFLGTVGAGTDFYADATTSPATGLPTGGSFAVAPGDFLYAHIFSSEAAYNAGQAAVQEIKYDTTGTNPIAIGDTIGSLKLAGYISTTNHGYAV